MKDGRTHLAHKAEHAVDLETGRDRRGDAAGRRRRATRRRLVETAIAAAEQVEAAHARRDAPTALDEIVADKGYHSNQTMVDLAGGRGPVLHRGAGPGPAGLDEDAGGAGSGLRQSPAHARRARQAAAAPPRRDVERSFAHVYDTGGMRRTHLRGHQNILKRLLIHASAFNLGLVMRHAFGAARREGCRDAVSPRVHLTAPSAPSPIISGRP